MFLLQEALAAHHGSRKTVRAPRTCLTTSAWTGFFGVVHTAPLRSNTATSSQLQVEEVRVQEHPRGSHVDAGSLRTPPPFAADRRAQRRIGRAHPGAGWGVQGPDTPCRPPQSKTSLARTHARTPRDATTPGPSRTRTRRCLCPSPRQGVMKLRVEGRCRPPALCSIVPRGQLPQLAS